MSMINKEIMLRGEAARQEKELRVLQKSCLATIKDQISELLREQIQVSKNGTYEEYVSGVMTPDEYRKRVDKLNQQAELPAGQLHDRQERLSVLEEELERMNVDMKQIIRYSHMEKLI